MKVFFTLAMLIIGLDIIGAQTTLPVCHTSAISSANNSHSIAYSYRNEVIVSTSLALEAGM